jgi:hypothetical protein
MRARVLDTDGRWLSAAEADSIGIGNSGWRLTMCNVIYHALPEIAAARQHRQQALGRILQSFNLLALLRNLLRRWRDVTAIQH